MAFEKGNKLAKGREPGSKNKPELKLFDIFSAEWLRKNGQDGFNKWADDNQTEAFRLIARRLPTNIEGEITLRKLVELDE